MPITPTYPGVYVLELPSSTHTISGVSTSNTAFIDFFPQGPVGKAVQLNSFKEFQRVFGGLDTRSESSYQLMQYYNNGGSVAYGVRVVPIDAMRATVDSLPSNAIFPGGQITLGYGESIEFSTNIEGEVIFSLSDSNLATLTTAKKKATLTIKPPPALAEAQAALRLSKSAADLVKQATTKVADGSGAIKDAIVTTAKAAADAAKVAADAAASNCALPTLLAAESAVILAANSKAAARAASKLARAAIDRPAADPDASVLVDANNAIALLKDLDSTMSGAQKALSKAGDTGQAVESIAAASVRATSGVATSQTQFNAATQALADAKTALDSANSAITAAQTAVADATAAQKDADAKAAAAPTDQQAKDNAKAAADLVAEKQKALDAANAAVPDLTKALSAAQDTLGLATADLANKKAYATPISTAYDRMVAGVNLATETAAAAMSAAGFPAILSLSISAAAASGNLSDHILAIKKAVDDFVTANAALSPIDADIKKSTDALATVSPADPTVKDQTAVAASAAKDQIRDAVTAKIPEINSNELLTLQSTKVTVTAWSEQSCTNCDDCSEAANCCTVVIVPPKIENLAPAKVEIVAPSQHVAFTASIKYGLRGLRWQLEDVNKNVVDESYGTIDPSKGIYIAPNVLPPLQTTVYAVPYSIDEEYIRAEKGAEIVINAAGPALTMKASNPVIALGKSSLLSATYNGTDLDPGDVSWSLPASGGDGNSEPKDLGKHNPFCFFPTDDMNGPVTLRAVYVDEDDGSTVKGDIIVYVGRPQISLPSDWTDDVTTHTVEVGHGVQFKLTAGGGDFVSPDTVWTLVSGHGILDESGFYKAPQTMPSDSPLVSLQAVTTIETADGTEQIVSSVTFTLSSATTRLTIKAANEGAWGNMLEAILYQSPSQASLPHSPFNLQVRLLDKLGTVLVSESYSSLNWDTESSQYVLAVVNAVSTLVELVDNGPDKILPYCLPARAVPSDAKWLPLSGGTDGNWADGEFAQSLISMLDPDGSPLTVLAPDIFNLLCIPATSNLDAGAASAVTVAAAQLCVMERAMLLVDIPTTQKVPNPDKMISWFEGVELNLQQKGCAATYYPRLEIPDPLRNFRPREVGTSGTMAGVYASMDVNRGVWKAPAGIGAGLAGALPTYTMKDSENGRLNPLGINAIRNFPVYSVVSWGARTMAGADELSDQWMYIPVRRLAQYIENSLFAGLKWAVFEPNDEPLWSSIRRNVNAFMSDLLRKGAFQGATPKDAYFVHCGPDTTTQYDIDRGIVNIIVGFAPLKPAEFVIVQIEQIAGQSS